MLPKEPVRLVRLNPLLVGEEVMVKKRLNGGSWFVECMWCEGEDAPLFARDSYDIGEATAVSMGDEEGMGVVEIFSP
jgi:hypothetical protein